MSKGRIQITITPRGNKPQRLVIAMSNDAKEELYRDSIDTDSASSRARFTQAVAKVCGVELSSLSWLDREIIEQADAASKDAKPEVKSASGETCEKVRKSIATQLVELATDVELFHCPDGDAFATFRVDNHDETAKVRSKAFRRWLSREYYVNFKNAPGSQALQDALGVLEGMAIYEGEEHEVHLRVAEYEGSIVLDLCNSAWQVVVIDKIGWRVLDESPVRFRRVKAMLPLPQPQPQRGGNLDELRELLNLGEVEWSLVAVWLVAALRPGKPFTILTLHGEQGSSKSTTAKALRCLIDPSSAPVRAEPKNAHDLAIAANNGWTVVFDNLSFIPTWLSDALCRLSTGGGFSTRMLFEDDEEVIFNAKRPVILTGIDEVATRGDLIDRSLLVSLRAIPEHLRVTEAEFWTKYETMLPRMLGALIDAVSVALKRLTDVRLEVLPRMADFAMWGTAAEPALGLKMPFLDAYSQNRDSANDLAMESSPLVKHILSFMEDQVDWQSTSTDLLEKLNDIASDADTGLKSWPKDARKLGGDLKRLAPNLRKVGVDIETGRSSGGRFVRLTRTDQYCCVMDDMNVMETPQQGCRMKA